MQNVVFIFPGQGSQSNQMLLPIQGYKVPEAMDVFDRVSDVCGFNLRKLITNGSSADLQKTKFTQIIIFAADMAYYQVLKSLNIIPNVVAGHSIGEYAALTVAGILDFSEACYLVRERARLMSAITTPGGLVALIGNNIDLSMIEDICQNITKKGELIAPALYNSPRQIIFGGTERGINMFQDAMKAFSHVLTKRLAVGQAFHTEILQPMAGEFSRMVDRVVIKKPKVPVLLNCSGEYCKAKDFEDEIKFELVSQCYSPVRWDSIMQKLVCLSEPSFIEVGPGNSLSSQLKSFLPGLKCICAEDRKTVLTKGRSLFKNVATV